MKIFRCLLFGIGLAVVLSSCQDIYIPKEINSNSRIPVIQGTILEYSPPYVKISWAMGYEDKVQEFISGALVSVSDNVGDSIILYEYSPGTYTNYYGGLIGVQGRSYRLNVILPDGNHYSSTSVVLPAKPVIDSLYAKPGINRIYSYNSDNEPVADNQKGLYIMSDISAYSDSILYFRFNTKMVTQKVYTADVGSMASHSVYVWNTSFLDNSYSVDYTVLQDSREVLREHHVGFLHYFYDASNETAIQTGTYTIGWILTFRVFSISRDVYDYYNSITHQLNSTDQIFAPVPSQVRSNIKCTNNRNSPVVGIFEASSFITIYKAFGWKSFDTYYVKTLASFPTEVAGGVSHRFQPSWWVNF